MLWNLIYAYCFCWQYLLYDWFMLLLMRFIIGQDSCLCLVFRNSWSKILFHREIFLPGSDGFGWIRSTDPVDRMSLSPGQIWSMPINLGCFDNSVCSAPSDHLNLFMLYLINLVVIDWPGWSGHSYQSVHIPISLPLLLCSFPCLDSGKIVILLRSRLLVTHYLVVLFVENPQLHRNKYLNAHTNTLTPTQTHSRTWKTPTPLQ